MTFDLLTSYSIGVFYWSCPSCIPCMKYMGPSIIHLLSGNHFSAEGHCDFSVQNHCDLDFRSTELKIYRDLPLGMTNLHTKYRVPGPKRSLVIERKLIHTTDISVLHCVTFFSAIFCILQEHQMAVEYWLGQTLISTILIKM